MPRTRYTEAEKQRALSALLATAVIRDGETVPNYAQVSAHLGISRKTLARWFTEREPERSALVCAAVEQERADARAEGAGIIRTMMQAIERQVAYIADPAHYDSTVHIDDSGRRYKTGARLDHAARALEVVLRSHDQVLTILGETSDSDDSQTLDTAREAARRTLMLRTLTGGKS